MGIDNINELTDKAPVQVDAPLETPTPENSQAGTPTPIDNVANETPADVGEMPEEAAEPAPDSAPEESATGDSDE